SQTSSKTIRRPSGVDVETSEESSTNSGGKPLFLTCSIFRRPIEVNKSGRVACPRSTYSVKKRTRAMRNELAFLPIVTSVVCESCSAVTRAWGSALSSSLPGRSAIAERSPRSIHRARSPPNEQFVPHLLHRQLRYLRPHQQSL